MADLKFDTAAFAAAVERKIERVTAGAKTGMHDAMDELLRESRDLAPLDKATLRRGSWTEVTESGDTVTGEVFYSAVEDGPNGRVNYALYMHEFDGKTEYANPTTPGTQPKYLEQPLKTNASRYLQLIADEIERS